MPAQSGSLLRGGRACFTGSRPARVAPHRLRPSVAANDRPAPASSSAAGEPSPGTVLLRVESNADGTVTFQFGGEDVTAAAPQVAQPAAAADAAAHLAHGSTAASSDSSIGSAAAPLEAGLPQHTGLAPPPWEAQEAAAATAAAQLDGSHGNGAAPIPAGAQEQHPYIRNGWYDPPFTPSSSSSAAQEDEEEAASTAELLARRASRRRAFREFYRGMPTAAAGAALAAEVAHSLDFREAQPKEVVALYEALCEGCQLDDALSVIKECIRHSRTDVLSRLKHYRFLRPAASAKAVKQALRFVQLLPRQYADARTYNMLLRVCARAGDLRNALHVADMLQAAGIRMDSILYTTLISACAAAGDAEKAFQLYGQMRADEVPVDKMVYASVVKACSQHISRLPPSERRQQLVLLERAFNLVEDMKAARVLADAAVWNALVTAAGRAGQLQRAFNVLEDMLHSNTRPNDRTYASLIDACARAGDKELALRVYRKAQREGCAASLMVYAAAVQACIQAAGGCDSEAVMAIYSDMQRNGVEPDSRLFGQLMKAAGAGGKLDLVATLQEEMAREGLQPCVGTQSALLAVYIRSGQLSEAQGIYRSMRAAGQWPAAYAMNALLNAYANHFRLGDVVSLVSEMVEGELRPDAFTFSAIFNACQRADEAELALDVARLMKLRGVRMDETHAAILLRICYNRLRQGWVQGGYPPHRAANGGAGTTTLPGSRRSVLRQKLVEALTPRGRQAELREQVEVAWVSQAFAIYREAVAAGGKPSLRMLNRMLMCLRVAWEGKQPSSRGDSAMAASPEALLPHHLPAQLGGAAAPVPRQEKIGVESVYHVQAVSILEEAIISNVVPSFKTDSAEPIDLRGMPPAVAEVYALTVLSAMQRQCEARRVVLQNLVFLVPPYDGSKVFMPSHLSHIDYEQIAPRAGATSASYDSDDEASGISFAEADAAFARASQAEATLNGAGSAGHPGGAAGDERTGLGVAGVLRRLRLWAREFGDRGFILLEAKEITRWCKATARAAERRSASALAVQKPYGQPYGQPLQGRAGLQQQQRQIRLGL